MAGTTGSSWSAGGDRWAFSILELVEVDPPSRGSRGEGESGRSDENRDLHSSYFYKVSFEKAS